MQIIAQVFAAQVGLDQFVVAAKRQETANNDQHDHGRHDNQVFVADNFYHIVINILQIRYYHRAGNPGKIMQTTMVKTARVSWPAIRRMYIRFQVLASGERWR